MFWLAVCAFVLAVAGFVWFSVRRWKKREADEEERMAAFLAATKGNVNPATPAAAAAPAPAAPAAAAGPADGLAQQKLLFEAAHKAGEAGEPALAIQLYARLLARYPATSFADQARARVEAEKKKLAKA
jgi:TolA-binding protein